MAIRDKAALGFLLTCVLLVLTSTANAKVLDTATLQVFLNIPQNLWVKVNVSELVFTEKDFDTTKNAVMLEEGIQATKRAAVQVVVAGNVPHALFVSALDDAFQGSQQAKLPSSQMDYRMTTPDDTDRWRQLGQKNHTSEPLFRATTIGKTTFHMDFRLLATWQDAPDTYEGTIVYTVMPL